ncbi:hypothetical protein D9V86_09690 [Bacteroidetes/Chlorobi group bacterium ChocPot_Mid]|jgi:hypothetical protein|nr:MAG: hypothetical protein D9V86_09690 [Bacteroidetes/Chlorobi group bacterium ChocPot_Mid]
MTYIDIFSDAISHFTNIPQDFVKDYIKSFSRLNGKKGVLIDQIMSIDFPEVEAMILLNDLKSGNLDNTLRFLMNSFDVIRQEEIRQSLVN